MELTEYTREYLLDSIGELEKHKTHLIRISRRSTHAREKQWREFQAELAEREIQIMRNALIKNNTNVVWENIE